MAGVMWGHVGSLLILFTSDPKQCNLTKESNCNLTKEFTNNTTFLGSRQRGKLRAESNKVYQSTKAISLDEPPLVIVWFLGSLQEIRNTAKFLKYKGLMDKVLNQRYNTVFSCCLESRKCRFFIAQGHAPPGG